jgi:uncharacterized protein YnzC (UPF0291/DUF896 family)
MEDKIKKFQADTIAKRQEVTQQVMTELLGEMLQKDLYFYDINYVFSKAIQVIEKAFEKTLFEDEEIKKLRTEYLKKSLQGVKYNIKDCYEVDGGDDDESTKNMSLRCQDVIMGLVDKVLEEKIILNDKEFIDTALMEDNKFTLYKLVKGTFDVAADMTLSSLSHSERMSDEYMWGCAKEDRKLSMLDNVLKDKKKLKSKKD